MKEVVVILNNIRSNENVGSIFRTSDATGVSKIYLAGITPGLLDRFNRENKGLVKSSLGAEQFVKWEKVGSLREVVERLKSHGFKIVAIEQDEKSVDYKGIKNLDTAKIALVFGTEVDGLSKTDLEMCDYVCEIPMKGKKESLNVAVSVGVVLYSLIVD